MENTTTTTTTTGILSTILTGLSEVKIDPKVQKEIDKITKEIEELQVRITAKKTRLAELKGEVREVEKTAEKNVSLLSALAKNLGLDASMKEALFKELGVEAPAEKEKSPKSTTTTGTNKQYVPIAYIDGEVAKQITTGVPYKSFSNFLWFRTADIIELNGEAIKGLNTNGCLKVNQVALPAVDDENGKEYTVTTESKRAGKHTFTFVVKMVEVAK